MKKLMTFLFTALGVFSLAACGKTEKTSTTTGTESPTTTVPTTTEVTASTTTTQSGAVEDPLLDFENCLIFHYNRPDDNYSTFNSMWLWPKGGDGSQVFFQDKDTYGMYYALDLTKYPETNEFGFIVRAGASWDKDPDGDRFADISRLKKDANGNYNVYLKTGDSNVYISAKGDLISEITGFAIGQTKLAGKSIYSLNFKTSIEFLTYKLTKNGQIISTSTDKNGVFSSTTKAAYINIGEEMPKLTDEFELTVEFPTGATAKKVADMTGLFDTEGFKTAYVYDGDLGAIYAKESTTFRVWSPVSTDMKLRVYATGTTKALGGSDEYTEYPMKAAEKGTWEVKVDGDLAGKYYTYVVTNAQYSNAEVVDPYAKSTGLNGRRGMIVDFDSTEAKPEGWDSVQVLNIPSTSLTVYETHIAELTASSTWGGTKEYSKTYKGFYETGTTYTDGTTTVSTGFDHIKELGVNAVQIIPVFDQDNEERIGKRTFNWGYNPLNYNALDGSYSTNPEDGYTKIKEFRELVQAYNAAGINIIMDVVYNHVMGASGSNFDVLCPGYYYRYNADGTLSNGSGCGNETASNRAMFRKFMVDSTEFWAETYKLGGFRFDLMGLHDIETMTELSDNLHEMNPYITVYGEPWTGGTSTLPSSSSAAQANMSKYGDFGAFNDKMRDGLIKGGMCGTAEKGWITSTTKIDAANAAAVKRGLAGLVFGQQNTPAQTVNYVTCHDNYTLYDRIVMAYISIDNNGTPWSWTGSEASSGRIWLTNAKGTQYMCSIRNNQLILQNTNNNNDVIVYTRSTEGSGKALLNFFGEWTNNGNEADKLVIGTKISDETTKQMAMLANSVVFTSQGISFMLAGEEFLRTKGLDHNSYMSSYDINEIDYSLKIKNADMVENYKALIALKQDASIFGLDKASANAIVVNATTDNAMLTYDIVDSETGRTYRIIHCTGAGDASTHVADLAGFTLYLDTLNSGVSLTEATQISAYQTIIAYKEA